MAGFPFHTIQIFITKHIYHGNTKNLFRQTYHCYPIKETCGESMETAIEISGVHINHLNPIEVSIIKHLFDDKPWTKVGQSLIHDNDKTYDKIEVVKLLLDNGETKRYEFWFDITECFGNNK